MTVAAVLACWVAAAAAAITTTTTVIITTSAAGTASTPTPFANSPRFTKAEQIDAVTYKLQAPENSSASASTPRGKGGVLGTPTRSVTTPETTLEGTTIDPEHFATNKFFVEEESGAFGNGRVSKISSTDELSETTAESTARHRTLIVEGRDTLFRLSSPSGGNKREVSSTDSPTTIYFAKEGQGMLTPASTTWKPTSTSQSPTTIRSSHYSVVTVVPRKSEKTTVAMPSNNEKTTTSTVLSSVVEPSRKNPDARTITSPSKTSITTIQMITTALPSISRSVFPTSTFSASKKAYKTTLVNPIPVSTTAAAATTSRTTTTTLGKITTLGRTSYTTPHSSQSPATETTLVPRTTKRPKKGKERKKKTTRTPRRRRSTTTPTSKGDRWSPQGEDTSTEAGAAGANDTDDEERRNLTALFLSRWPVDLWRRHGLFRDDYLRVINAEWMRYEPPAPAAHYALAALYFVIMTVGTTGNGLVVYLFFRSKSLRTPANTLVVNLAISDFFMLLDMALFIYNSVLLGPALGLIGCQLYGFVGGLTGTTSIVTLALIAYDRYCVIVFPMEPRRRTSHARARALAGAAWAYGATFASVPLAGAAGVSPFSPEGYLTSCSFDYMSSESSNRIYILCFFCAAWVVPLSVILFCYARIYRMVLTAAEVSIAVDSQRHCREEEKRRSELKLAGVVAGVVVLWFASWTPYAVVALLGVSGQHRALTPLATMVPALFCKTASCVDPFVYAVTHPRFRKELRSLWRRRMRRRRDRRERRPRGPRGAQGHRGRGKAPWTVEQAAGVVRADRERDETSESTDQEDVLVLSDFAAAAGQSGSSSGSMSASSDNERSAEDGRASRRGKGRRRSQRISWLKEQSLPFPSGVLAQLHPPSWFVSPQPAPRRSSSLKLSELKGQNKANSRGPVSM